jgi:disulfide bond formation protein DsbB
LLRKSKAVMLHASRAFSGGEMSDTKKWPGEAIYMVRTMQQHHVQLSIMADQKANMLIGATFVVLTLAIGQSQNSSFSLPLAILAVSAFMSAGLATMAVMPSTVPKPSNGSNWLFFGTFAQSEEQVFQEKIMAKLKEPEDVFEAMLHDIYQMGCILQTKKYRYLGWAYRAFLAGLVTTFVTFVYERFAGPIL